MSQSQLLAADIVSAVHNSPDSRLNLCTFVEGKIEPLFKRIAELEGHLSPKLDSKQSEVWPRWFRPKDSTRFLWEFKDATDRGTFHDVKKNETEPSNYSPDELIEEGDSIELTREQAYAILEGAK